jgi:hypothetical protein
MMHGTINIKYKSFVGISEGEKKHLGVREVGDRMHNIKMDPKK